MVCLALYRAFLRSGIGDLGPVGDHFAGGPLNNISHDFPCFLLEYHEGTNMMESHHHHFILTYGYGQYTFKPMIMTKQAKIQLCSTQNSNLFGFASSLFTNLVWLVLV